MAVKFLARAPPKEVTTVTGKFHATNAAVQEVLSGHLFSAGRDRRYQRLLRAYPYLNYFIPKRFCERGHRGFDRARIDYAVNVMALRRHLVELVIQYKGGAPGEGEDEEITAEVDSSLEPL